MFSKPRKLEEKVSVFLSHIKTRHGYDFTLYFRHELLMSFNVLLYSFEDVFSYMIHSLKRVGINQKTKIKAVKSLFQKYEGCRGMSPHMSAAFRVLKLVTNF